MDEFGNVFTLHRVLNVNLTVIAAYLHPQDTQAMTDNTVKHKQGDGFIVFQITDSQATCKARGCHAATSGPEWDYSFSL